MISWVGSRKRQSAYLLERFESRKRQHVPDQKSNSRKRQREYRRPCVYFTQSPVPSFDRVSVEFSIETYGNTQFPIETRDILSEQRLIL